jgi:hypothetical protein
MRKLVGTGLALGLVTLAVGVSGALADSNGAVIMRDTGCIVYDGNGFLTFVQDDQIVTNSQNGNETCSGQVTPSSTGHAVVYNDKSNGLGRCQTPGGGTVVADHWSETVSASGQMTLRTHCSE